MNLTVQIDRILVPTDFSHPSKVACHLAARLAGYLKARVVLLHAISGMDLLEEVGRARGKTRDEVLDDFCDRLGSWFKEVVPAELGGVLPVELKVVVGEPAPAVAPAAKRSGADLILMATHGRTGLAHLLLGSVAETVLRSTPVPVLALRPGQWDRPLTMVHRIIWATDLSPVSEGVWRYALTLADVFRAEVVLLHVVPPVGPPGAANRPDRELERRQQEVEAIGLAACRKIVVGVPTKVILAEALAEEADLIIVGTRGRTGLAHILLGSVAEAVLRKAPCPVLAVHVKSP